MASKAWYKATTPKLIGRFTNSSPSSSSPPHFSPTTNTATKKKAIEIWTTTCILTNFGKQRLHLQNDRVFDSSYQQVTTLINPANPNLSGPSAFPYFPRGGPQPNVQPNRNAHHIMGYVSQWGGMDVGSGMMFSAETIDGLLHQLGGLRFRTECSLFPPHPYAHAYLNQQRPKTSAASANNDAQTVFNTSNYDVTAPNPKTKCPVGTAVLMPAVGGELPLYYDHIIHTVPPFYKYPPSMTNEMKQLLGIQIGVDEEDLHTWSKEMLRSCYRQSFNVAFGTNCENIMGKGQSYSLLNNFLVSLIGLGKHRRKQSSQSQRVAVPLLGAGCRDFPKPVALEVAALESASWLLSHSEKHTESSSDKEESVIAFGLIETSDAEALSNNIEETIKARTAL